MREMRDILTALEGLHARGEAAALATVVRARGSTYRREGARLLVLPGGATVGSISGGCLEGDVAEVAREVIRTGRPRLLTYDLTSDDDTVWGLGLGCNGAIEVFVERVGGGEGDLVRYLRRALEDHEPLALVTVVSAPPGGPSPGSRLAVPERGEPMGSLGDPALDAHLAHVARRQLELGRSTTLSVEGGEVFVEVVAPPVPLVVCGAGHDAIPLVRLARELGWWVTVVDSRPAYAVRERFPEADDVVLAEDEEVPRRVRIDARTYVVVMTHNFLHDVALLRGLLGTPARYIGLLGPRARTERMLKELERGGVRVDDVQRSRLYAPVGLDLGAESPQEIALSILAEILAVQKGRRVASLRDRAGPIHAPAAP
jgi:xanthine/CO dehydrogenase XdhC/CoxF family maturation factor